MTGRQSYILGCDFAIHQLTKKGSEFYVVHEGNQYIQVAWKDILEWLEKEYNKQEPTTKNEKVDCEHTDCNNCVNHKYCDYEPTTKNDLGVDCISREQTIDRVVTYFNHIDKGNDDEWAKGYEAGAEDAIAVIESMNPVTPQEPKTGHWYIDERPESNREVTCSNCDQPMFKYHRLDFDYRPKYCPNCGAKMVKENEDATS